MFIPPTTEDERGYSEHGTIFTDTKVSVLLPFCCGWSHKNQPQKEISKRAPMRGRSPVIKRLACILAMIFGGGCTTLHHAQVGEIDAKVVLEGERFELLLSELGINVDDAAAVAKVFAGKRASKQVEAVRDIIKLFQMGPKTGNPVFDEDYADELAQLLMARCPSGQISGLVSIRETAAYPVVSGEIIKLVGYCLRAER